MLNNSCFYNGAEPMLRELHRFFIRSLQNSGRSALMSFLYYRFVSIPTSNDYILDHIFPLATLNLPPTPTLLKSKEESCYHINA